jgi:hypothetical protein
MIIRIRTAHATTPATTSKTSLAPMTLPLLRLAVHFWHKMIVTAGRASQLTCPGYRQTGWGQTIDTEDSKRGRHDESHDHPQEDPAAAAGGVT